MKATSFLFIVASLLVCQGPLFVGAADSSDGSLRGGNDKSHRHLQQQHTQTPFDPTKVKVLVEYETEKGSETAKQRASKVSYESKRFKIVAMEIDSKEMLALENDPEIRSVSLDEEVHIIFPVRNYDNDVATQGNKPKPPLKKPSTRRRLAESVPYGVSRIQADLVIPGDDASQIKVCIVDTGYDLGHPDLPGLGTVDGDNNTEYGSGGMWDEDIHGHGTHCAGIVAALGNNGIGVRGAVMNATSDGITLHIGKGLESDGYGSSAGVLEAVDQCINAGANIISMSLGGGGYSSSAESLYQTAYEDLNVLIVAAASNDGNSEYSYPASYPAVMSVAATNSNDQRASFSNFNDQVEISAPGVSVESTLPRNHGDGPYHAWSGTSMATPYVAGAAALLWSHNATCTAREIRTILLASAKPLAADGCDNYYGRGLVQVQDALTMLQEGGCEAAYSTGIFASSNGLNTGNTCENYEYVQSCPRSERSLTITIQTDNAPTEISWEVKNVDNQLVAFGGGYGTSNSLVTETVGFCVGSTYSFTMMDSGGNGISGNGAGYSLELGNEMLRPFNAMVGSLETTGDIFVPCDPAQEMVTLNLYTDRYPAETTWELKYSSSTNVIHSGGPYSELETQHLEYMCVEKGNFYDFTIYDSPTYEDGICCGYGYGNYTVMCGDEIVIDSDGNFGYTETNTFEAKAGAAEPLPEEPSMTPSLNPSGSPSKEPSKLPSSAPSSSPSWMPSLDSSSSPSSLPSPSPSTDKPSTTPSDFPSTFPSLQTSSTPSSSPSLRPTINVSEKPSFVPSNVPSAAPSPHPSVAASKEPSSGPSGIPTSAPSLRPSAIASDEPSSTPSDIPSDSPSIRPSIAASEEPSTGPSDVPTLSPSLRPSATASDDISDIQVTNLVLVDATTNEDIPGAFDCHPHVCTNNAPLLDIRAETMDGVQSVRFRLVGPVSQEPRVESVAPWALFRDIEGDFEGAVLKPGDYTVTAEPFSMTGANGIAGPMMQMQFSIGDGTADTGSPSTEPSMMPSTSPSVMPSSLPSALPSFEPSMTPSEDPLTPGWNLITSDNFETDWGNFEAVDGTTDVKRQWKNTKQGPYIPEGNYAIRIRDNEGELSSVFHSTWHSVKRFSKLRIQFSFCARQMNGSEDFFVEYSNDNGATYRQVKQYVNKVDFDNNQCYREYGDNAIVLEESDFNPETDQARLRFRCDASGNGDFIYVDEVLFEGFV